MYHDTVRRFTRLRPQVQTVVAHPPRKPTTTGTQHARTSDHDETHGQPDTEGNTVTYRVCSTPGCGTLHQGRGACPKCKANQDKTRRPNGNPYATKGHQRFREAVLTRDPICITCMRARATIADHHPLDRTQLIERGLDPNDPKHGRGLCKPCHDRHTAQSHGQNRGT